MPWIGESRRGAFGIGSAKIRVVPEADRPLMDRVWRERYALRAGETA